MAKCEFFGHAYTLNASFRQLIWSFDNILPRNTGAHVSLTFHLCLWMLFEMSKLANAVEAS